MSKRSHKNVTPSAVRAGPEHAPDKRPKTEPRHSSKHAMMMEADHVNGAVNTPATDSTSVSGEKKAKKQKRAAADVDLSHAEPVGGDKQKKAMKSKALQANDDEDGQGLGTAADGVAEDAGTVSEKPKKKKKRARDADAVVEVAIEEKEHEAMEVVDDEGAVHPSTVDEATGDDTTKEKKKKKQKKHKSTLEVMDESQHDTEQGAEAKDVDDGEDTQPAFSGSGPGSVIETWKWTEDPTLHASALAVESLNLHPTVSDVLLNKLHIERLFPLQKQIIPVILQAHQASDVCVAAATGSGKTLCYVLPIVQMLSSRVITRLRALVVLPTRDLAIQVKSVFDAFCEPLGLKVAVAIGDTSFAEEQSRLVDTRGDVFTVPSHLRFAATVATNAAPILLPSLLPSVQVSDRRSGPASSAVQAPQYDAMDRAALGLPFIPVTLAAPPASTTQQQRPVATVRGLLTPNANVEDAHGKVDILVCTPGRLIDHIQSTPGFTLQHVTHLVIDEADRLLTQHYQDWIHRVLDAIVPPSAAHPSVVPSRLGGFRLEPTTQRPAKEVQAGRLGVQKLLFSATLTRNPQKLGLLALRNPVFFSHVSTAPQQPGSVTTEKKEGADVEDTGADKAVNMEADGAEAPAKRYHVPAGLKEYLLVCKPAQKPLVLLHLLETLGSAQTIIFTSSVEATHRLLLLVQFYTAHRAKATAATTTDAPASETKVASLNVASYSSSLTQDQRSAIIDKFRRGLISTLVCSDVMARGMDIDHVSTVINYDVPHHIKTYIHRIGRTARGVHQGNAISLAQPTEVKHFKEILRKADNSKLLNYKWKPEQLEPLRPAFTVALAAMQTKLRDEAGIRD